MKNKRIIFVLVFFMFIGVTLAFYSNSKDFINIFYSSIYGTSIKEDFVSPSNWKPGDTVDKKVYATNTGEVDELVRVCIDDNLGTWMSKSGTSWDNTKDNFAIINENEDNFSTCDSSSTWKKKTENGKICYYYTSALKEGETTINSPINSVTYSSSVEVDSNCTTVTSNGKKDITCTSTDDGYANATYKLPIVVETIQANMAESAWGYSIDDIKSVSDLCEEEHNLKINYLKTDGSIIKTYTSKLKWNDTYSVASPSVEGYTCDIEKVSGTMKNKDIEVDVVYSANTYSITYENFSDTSNLPTSFIYPNEIDIELNEEISNLKLFVNDTTLMVENSSYTIESNKLHINTIAGNITIIKEENTFGGVTNSILTFADESNMTESSFGDFTYSGDLSYDEDGSLISDYNTPTLNLSLADSDLNDEYSLYITVKADTSQVRESFASGLVAISESNAKYLSWIGFYKNYFHSYSYRNGQAISNKSTDYTIDSFTSFEVSSYSNKMLNIQVVGKRGGTTKIYFNGELVKEFNSGSTTISYTSISIGDLRQGRNLKFKGNIYDFAFYTKALTESEVNENFEYAKNKFNIE